jgi:phosphohistidine phosphatase
MKRLYLLRHAKSSWSDPDLPDRERPLAGRGRRAAKAMSRHLREAGVDPDLVLCSPARRTRETLERIEPVFGRGAVRVEPGLYAAGADDLLALVCATPAHVESVMLIGHNPGLEELALVLARGSALRDQVSAKFPTAALVTVEFGVAVWGEVSPGTGDVVAFVRPRDLVEPR